MSPSNHSNFPGALWRTDNSLRGVPFLFFTPPSFPPSHLFSLPLLSRAVCWMLASWFSSSRPASFFMRVRVCAAKFELQSSERQRQTTVAAICTPLSALHRLRAVGELCFCASRRLLRVGTERNVLQRHRLSPWFFCLHFRGCAVKPWCCPRDHSPWEYAMLNSKYHQTFSPSLCVHCWMSRFLPQGQEMQTGTVRHLGNLMAPVSKCG